MNIGVFDSGFGGIDILRHIVKKLPQYNYIYLGDNARTPYGSRSKATLYKYTTEAVDFLFAHNCPLIIIACNTASAEALPKIQRVHLPKYHPHGKILGVVVPAVETAAAITAHKRVGVIATEGSVASGAFVREFRKINSEIKVFQEACPLLVPIVESGENDKKILQRALRNYLKPLVEEKIDTLILGCTHYSILEEDIRTALKYLRGNGIHIVNEGDIVADKLETYLKKHPEITKILKTQSKRVFYTTDVTDRFRRLGSIFFGNAIKPRKAHLS
ncbi:glutamate racemase [Candidatus Kaiserbacteria bacterium]|nr:glutamate racemase [Candidatus Kaiserbacteria bacterium]